MNSSRIEKEECKYEECCSQTRGGETRCVTATWLAQLGGRWSAEQEVMGSSPSWTNTHGV